MDGSNKPKLLIVDDEQAVLNALRRSLRNDFEIFLSLSGPAGLQILREQEIMVILADQRMPEMTGVEFFRKALEIQPDAVRVMITGYSDVTAIVDAINKGNVFYYISKPWDTETLKIILARAVERYEYIQENRGLTRQLEENNKRLAKENIVLRQEVERHYHFDKIIGRSGAIQKVFSLMKKVIPTDTTILISGETGTGKELVAQAIHYNGPRGQKLFIAQNCAALPDSLLESTLFGHVKGAFTDAINDRKGLFELADGGTIFLDEIGSTSLAFQQRLLRVIQEGEIAPVGSGKVKKVDVRIISATNQDLAEAVAKGSFRQDLYYRLNVFPIHLPPLRERIEDIPILVQHFYELYSRKLGRAPGRLNEAILEKLLNNKYPGNVRELENIVERIVVLSDGDNPEMVLNNIGVGADAFSGTTRSRNENISITLAQVIESVERQYISNAITRYSGNISKAARGLGLSRAGLYKKIRRYKLL